MALQTAMPTKSLSTTPFKTDPLVDDDIQEEIEDFELHLSDDDPDALSMIIKIFALFKYPVQGKNAIKIYTIV